MTTNRRKPVKVHNKRELCKTMILSENESKSDQRRIYLWTRHRNRIDDDAFYAYECFLCFAFKPFPPFIACDGSMAMATGVGTRIGCQQRMDLIQFISFSGRFSNFFCFRCSILFRRKSINSKTLQAHTTTHYFHTEIKREKKTKKREKSRKYSISRKQPVYIKHKQKCAAKNFPIFYK